MHNGLQNLAGYMRCVNFKGVRGDEWVLRVCGFVGCNGVVKG